VNSKTQSHLRGLAEEFGESTNAVRKELNNLTKAGILTKKSEKNKIEYQANVGHPFFSNIQEIIRKYLGLDQLLQQILDRMGEVSQVVLIGDMARGIDSGKIEVVVIGDALNEDYIISLSTKIEQMIERKVEFTLLDKRMPSPGLILFDKESGN
jgi:predicted NACHT family NTPase